MASHTDTSPGPMFQRVDELFEDMAASKPTAIACVFDAQEITYAELNRRSNQLAHSLIARGVGPAAIVGIHMARSVDMIVALFGILKTGAAYLPMDPSYPRDRLEYMARDADVLLILTTQAILTALSCAPTYCYLPDSYDTSSDPSSFASSNVDRAALGTSITDPAYIIYTSGTTGRPKGVITTHRNLTNFLLAMVDSPGITAADTCLAITSLSFDPHVLEILLPLIVGAKTILVRDADTTSPDNLAFLIEKHHVSIMQGTPATWQMMQNNNWKPSTRLKALCGGESMTPALKAALLAHPGLALWNVYGPTETTVWCSAKEMFRHTDICIGPPIRNVRFYVLNEALAEVSIGDVGELHIGGEGLARGYLNQPQLTSEKFIGNPFLPESSDRLFKSGDMVRRLSDDCVQYLNRADYQVKIRGFRIELLEVEAAITKCPEVSEAAVIADGSERLIAFVVATDQSADNHALSMRIRDVVEKALPQYMIPSTFHVIDRMPLTPNRKTDRYALSTKGPSLLQGEPSPWAYTEVGHKLHKIWCDILSQSYIGPQDRYRDVGGNSINLITLRLRIMETWKRDLPIKELKRHDTIEAMGGLIQSTAPMPIATQPRQDNRTCLLSPSQELLLIEIAPDRISFNNLEFLLVTERPANVVHQAIAILLTRHDVFCVDRIGLRRDRCHQHFSQAATTNVIDATCDFETAADFIGQLSSYRELISLATGRLYKWVIFNAVNCVYVYFIANHFIIDDISINILKDEMDMLLRDMNADLPNMIPFSEWLEHHKAILDAGRYDDEIGYWRRVVKPMTALLQAKKDTGLSDGIAVLKRTFRRKDVGFTGRRTQEAHDAILACCSFTMSSLFSLNDVPCRMVASGRSIFDDINDSFTVGWLAYHYPLLISVGNNVLDTYRNLVGNIGTVPHQGSGYGWLRYVTRCECLLAGAQLTEFPMYFNFLPRRHVSSTTSYDMSHLLQAMPEERSTMVGIGFVVEEFEDYFSIAAAYDSAKILAGTAAEGLDQLKDHLQALCKALD